LKSSGSDADEDEGDEYEDSDYHRADEDLLFRGINAIIPRQTYKCLSCEPPDCAHIGQCVGALQVSLKFQINSCLGKGQCYRYDSKVDTQVDYIIQVF
jgi:hypothetical protein